MPRGRVVLTGAAIPRILDEIFQDLRMDRVFDDDVLVFGLAWSLKTFSESTIPVVIDFGRLFDATILLRPQLIPNNFKLSIYWHVLNFN